MRQLDKERRKKAKGIPDSDAANNTDFSKSQTELASKSPTIGGKVSATTSRSDAVLQSSDRENISDKKIHTEIRTNDFVVRLLLSTLPSTFL